MPGPERTALLSALVAAGLVAGCAGGTAPDPTAPGSPPPVTSPPATSGPTTLATPLPSTSPTPSPGRSAAEPLITAIGDAQWQRMVTAGVWRPGCPVGRKDLRRVEIDYRDFDGGVSRGALVVNADVAESVAGIFSRIFDAGFPIERMRPIEAYGGDDLASMKDDNTSAFNCRKPDQANAPSALSPHANGRAIDINPYRNPWMDPRCRCWQPSATYAEKPRTAPGTITKGSAIWRIFTREGWIWQDIKVTDYMHFDTGYPSHPLAPAATAGEDG